MDKIPVAPMLQEELDVMATWMIQNHVPTCGPVFATQLLKVATAMKVAAEKIEDERVRGLIMEHVEHMKMAGLLLGFASGAVIEKLGKAVENATPITTRIEKLLGMEKKS